MLVVFIEGSLYSSVVILGGNQGEAMNSFALFSANRSAQLQAPVSTMLSAAGIQYYPAGHPTPYGKPPRSAVSYYGTFGEPLPSPPFLPTPPLSSPLSFYTRAQFFPTHVPQPVHVQAHLPKPPHSSDAAVTLLALHEPIVHSEASPTDCKAVNVIACSPAGAKKSPLTPPSCAKMAPEEPDTSSSSDQGYVSQEIGHEATTSFAESPSGQAATPFPVFSHQNPRPPYSHVTSPVAYPPQVQMQHGYAPGISYPQPSHIQSIPYFPVRRPEDTFPRNNSCHICGKTYARQSTLKTHLRTHNGEKPYQCSICQKSFTQAANLTAHLRTHSGEKPFKCPVCNRGFSQSSSVTTHMRTHSGERPYKCNVCGKGFADSSTLTKHYRTHTGEKPYQCKICDARFSQSGNLNRHMRTHRNHFQGVQVVSRTP